jgi:DNA-binding CsgD family transcriptional regulator
MAPKRVGDPDRLDGALHRLHERSGKRGARPIGSWRRLREQLEAELRASSFFRAAFETALEEIPAAAFVVEASWQVRQTNGLGRSRALQLGARLCEQLRQAMSQAATTSVVVRKLPGSPESYLVVDRQGAAASRVEQLGPAWCLTRRQTDVCGLLARGESNKVIASMLGCGERTVEAHITQVFAKAGVRSRAELLVKVWST